MHGSMTRLGTALVVLTASLVASILALTVTSASAIDCTPPATPHFYADGSYDCVSPGGGGGDGDDGGSGGTTQPTCALDQVDESAYADKPGRGSNYCNGTKVCFTTDVFVPMAPPDGDPPKKDSKAKLEWCYPLLGGEPQWVRSYWTDDDEPPSLLEQAQTAIGQIKLGTPTIGISPATRTLVNLDTWFWLDGAKRQATGSSAFGLVAIATFESLSVDPGDATGSFPCADLPTNADEAQQSCHHEYRRSSVHGSSTVDGRPAYAITAHTVYTLRFEVNGVPRDVPGAPTTLDGPPATAAVRVDEVQSVVTAG